MKKANVFLVLLMSIVGLQAMAYQVVVEAHANKVGGYSNYSKSSPTSCTYSVLSGRTNQGTDEVVIFLNSDKTTMINASIRLTPEQVPLQEGTIVSRDGLIIKYKNGVLTQAKREVSEVFFNNDYKIVELNVSADLKQISSGYTKSAVKGIIREKLLGEMECEF